MNKKIILFTLNFFLLFNLSAQHNVIDYTDSAIFFNNRSIDMNFDGIDDIEFITNQSSSDDYHYINSLNSFLVSEPLSDTSLSSAIHSSYLHMENNSLGYTTYWNDTIEQYPIILPDTSIKYVSIQNASLGVSGWLKLGFYASGGSGFVIQLLEIGYSEELTTSINSNLVNESFSVYPTVTNDFIFLTKNSDDNKFLVFDINGKLILTKNLETTTSKINCLNLGPGMYYVSNSKTTQVFFKK